MNETFELQPLTKDRHVTAPISTQHNTLVVATQIIAYLSLSVSFVAPTAYTILFLSGKNLTTTQCTASAIDWTVFWDAYSEKRMLPLWITVYMVTTRLWVFYETQRYVTLNDAPGMLAWATSWRFTRACVVAIYTILIDAAFIIWINNASNVCYDKDNHLNWDSEPYKHVMYSMCFHTLNIDVAPQLMLYTATLILMALVVCIFILFTNNRKITK